MEQWIRQILSANQLELAAFPAAFLLGVLGAASSCCTLPVVGAVAGYAGSLGGRAGRRDLLFVGLCFMIGTMLSLAALGALTGFAGRLAGTSLGRYWRFAAGLLMMLFGLASLRLLPLRVPGIDLGDRVFGRGLAGAMAYGLAVGGATTACSVGCNPLLSLALSAAVLKGTPFLGAAVLAAFALGYSLSLAAGLIGIGFGLGRLGAVAHRVMPAVRMGGGVLLVAVAFYLLATV